MVLLKDDQFRSLSIVFCHIFVALNLTTAFHYRRNCPLLHRVGIMTTFPQKSTRGKQERKHIPIKTRKNAKKIFGAKKATQQSKKYPKLQKVFGARESNSFPQVSPQKGPKKHLRRAKNRFSAMRTERTEMTIPPAPQNPFRPSVYFLGNITPLKCYPNSQTILPLLRREGGRSDLFLLCMQEQADVGLVLQAQSSHDCQREL